MTRLLTAQMGHERFRITAGWKSPGSSAIQIGDWTVIPSQIPRHSVYYVMLKFPSGTGSDCGETIQAFTRIARELAAQLGVISYGQSHIAGTCSSSTVTVWFSSGEIRQVNPWGPRP
jgi:hypothetical protein